MKQYSLELLNRLPVCEEKRRHLLALNQVTEKVQVSLVSESVTLINKSSSQLRFWQMVPVGVPRWPLVAFHVIGLTVDNYSQFPVYNKDLIIHFVKTGKFIFFNSGILIISIVFFTSTTKFLIQHAHYSLKCFIQNVGIRVGLMEKTNAFNGK